jgi:hypothetical protein
MALHGSASANLSPILFKGNNRALGVNVLIHQDQSGSMVNLIQFYSNGTFIGSLQDALLEKKIGDDITRYPNLYAYFDLYGRNSSTSFSITNPNGSLLINQTFMRGEITGSATINRWTSANYFSNKNSHFVNICSNIIGATTGGRLTTRFGTDQISEDVHGSLWSIFTSPNAISTGTAGRYGSIIGSNVRKGSTTVIITNSDEQDNAPGDIINQLVAVSGGSRTINGPTGEMIFRNYRVIALSSYTSTDGFDGVLFYGSTSTQPYGYVTFTSDTTYTITRSTTAPNWTRTTSQFNNINRQIHDTLTLASETRGGLFKIFNAFNTAVGGVDRRVAFSRCLAEFIADTV